MIAGKKFFPDGIRESRELLLLIRVIVFCWAVLLLASFLWSQLRFFAGRLQPFFNLFGIKL
ncbi:MAG: hypothetical protein QMD08_06995 [Actinomycetota bacterium]|nr:hypothetical protein [Actinomycetota bacterium]